MALAHAAVCGVAAALMWASLGLGAESTPLAAARPSCTISDRGFSDPVAPGVPSGSWQDCQARCAEVAECRFFTHSADQAPAGGAPPGGTCTMHGESSILVWRGEAGGGLMITSGPRSCQRHRDWLGFLPHAPLASSSSSSSSSASSSSPGLGAAAAAAAAAASCTSATWRFVPNMRDEHVGALATWEACQRRCRRVANCLHFAHDAGTLSCQLQDRAARLRPVPAPPRPKPSLTAGPFSCDDRSLWMHPPAEASPRGVAALRQRLPSFLGSLAASPGKQLVPTAEMVIQSPFEQTPHCVAYNVRYVPIMKQAIIPQSASDETVCRKACQAVAGCAHFSYVLLTRECFLQDANATLEEVLCGAGERCNFIEMLTGNADCSDPQLWPIPARREEDVLRRWLVALGVILLVALFFGIGSCFLCIRPGEGGSDEEDEDDGFVDFAVATM